MSAATSRPSWHDSHGWQLVGTDQDGRPRQVPLAGTPPVYVQVLTDPRRGDAGPGPAPGKVPSPASPQRGAQPGTNQRTAGSGPQPGREAGAEAGR